MKTLIDDYQQHRLGVNHPVSESTADLEDLRHRVEMLMITCQALWEIVHAQTGVSEAEMLAKMQEVDGRDGRLDGKIATGMLTCPVCNRPNNATSTNCIYCGAVLDSTLV